jgi:hypothetical protein
VRVHVLIILIKSNPPWNIHKLLGIKIDIGLLIHEGMLS